MDKSQNTGKKLWIPANENIVKNFLAHGFIYPIKWNRDWKGKVDSWGCWHKDDSVPMDEYRKNDLLKDWRSKHENNSLFPAGSSPVIIKLNGCDPEDEPLIPLSKVSEICVYDGKEKARIKNWFKNYYGWEVVSSRSKKFYGGPLFKVENSSFKKLLKVDKENLNAVKTPSTQEAKLSKDIEKKIVFLKKTVANLLAYHAVSEGFSEPNKDFIKSKDFKHFEEAIEPDFSSEIFFEFPFLEKRKDEFLVKFIQDRLFEADVDSKSKKLAFLKSASEAYCEEFEKAKPIDVKLDSAIRDKALYETSGKNPLGEIVLFKFLKDQSGRKDKW